MLGDGAINVTVLPSCSNGSGMGIEPLHDDGSGRATVVMTDYTVDSELHDARSINGLTEMAIDQHRCENKKSTAHPSSTSNE